MEWLLIDANYLCHRAYHAMGGELTHADMTTGMLFGFFRDVVDLQERFSPGGVVFAFDHGRGVRCNLYPEYKANRQQAYQEMSEPERVAYAAFRDQIKTLRFNLLPRCGFPNVLSVQGYEADDIIASVAKGLGPDDTGVVVSADADLLQLLAANVRIYNPRRQVCYTADDFRNEWGLEPGMWPHVKALAGDDGDNVPGIRGIGLKLAAKWYQGKLKPDSVAAQKINAGLDVHNRNIQLVRLPYPGTPTFKPIHGWCRPEGWADVMGQLGIKSLGRPARAKGVQQRGQGKGGFSSMRSGQGGGPTG